MAAAMIRKLLIFLFAISRFSSGSGSLLPYHGVTVGIQPHSGPVHSQYHSQDKYGQYVYGYASGLSAADEIKTADGITRGGYSYIDAHGILQTVQYISDPIHGFRVSATNIPRDVPAVAIARAQHLQAFENIKAEHAYISAVQAHSPVHISPLPAVGNVVVPVTAAHLGLAPQPVHQAPLPQYHAQDHLGQYSYGYAGPLSSKTETKSADGVTRGGYSYIDANGVLQSVQYVSDPIHGFRVQATNLPEAPAVTLIGPKVTTSVVGPKEEVLVQSGISGASPAVAVSGQSVAHFANPAEVAYQSPPPVFINPVSAADHPIIPDGNNPVVSQPLLTNPIQTVPFLSNGKIASHTNLNLLVSQASPARPIDTLNPPVAVAVPSYAQASSPLAAVPRYEATHQGPPSYNGPLYPVETPQGSLYPVQPVLHPTNFQNPPAINRAPAPIPAHILIREQAVLPDHAISKDLINSGPINVDAGLINGGPGVGAAGPGSIPDGPGLFIPRDAVQQVQQSPVNGEQQALGGFAAVQHPPDIQGPTGYYTQQTNY